MNLKNYQFIQCTKDQMIFRKDLISLKLLIYKQMKIKIYKKKVLNDVVDLFNELYYIYKDKYNEEKMV